MSDTQIIIALVVGASVFIAICCLILIVIVRLRRAVKSQFETLNNLLSTLHADRERDTPPEPGSK
ncbi:MAG TPA: hypothetical protein VGO16_08565 [Pseudonocardiaceae bacterium]|nr:hypothetical protein [Pseudonocardiaceae bacterium]